MTDRKETSERYRCNRWKGGKTDASGKKSSAHFQKAPLCKSTTSACSISSMGSFIRHKIRHTHTHTCTVLFITFTVSDKGKKTKKASRWTDMQTDRRYRLHGPRQTECRYTAYNELGAE